MVVGFILHKRTVVMFNRDLFQHLLYFLIRLKQQHEIIEKWGPRTSILQESLLKKGNLGRVKRLNKNEIDAKIAYTKIWKK